MGIQVSCQCGQRFSAASHLRGKRVQCTSCGRPIEIPAASGASAAQVPQSPLLACQCGQKFKAAAHLAGRQVQCPSCGRPLAIPQTSVSSLPASPESYPPSAANDPLGLGDSDLWEQVPATTLPASPALSGSSSGYTTRTTPKSSVNWKRLAGIGGVVALIAIVVAGAVIGGRAVYNKMAGPVENVDPASVPDVFQKPPAHSAIVDTDQNWRPAPEILKELSFRQTADDYAIRLPDGFERYKKPGTAHMHTWRRTGGDGEQREYIVLAVQAWGSPEGPTDADVAELEANLGGGLPAGHRNVKVQRGRVNGFPCYRVVSQYEPPALPGVSYHSCGFDILDREKHIVFEGAIAAAPGTREYELFETALRSINRR